MGGNKVTRVCLLFPQPPRPYHARTFGESTWFLVVEPVQLFFQDRLGYSAKPELLPLVRLSRDLPPFRARALREAGYPSPIELATAETALVADVLLRCAPFRSAGWDESVVRASVPILCTTISRVL